MTAEPLFLDSMDALLAALRLTDVRSPDARAIVEQGVRMARVRFYQRLGASTIQAILETDNVEDPTTDDEMKRFVGNLCEAELVRLQLVDRLPVVFMDASGHAREAYNNEGAFRSMDRETLLDIRQRIEAQVENWLALMAGEIELGDDEAVQAYTQQDVDPKPVLGMSTFIGADQEVPFSLNPGEFDGNFILDDEIQVDE